MLKISDGTGNDPLTVAKAFFFFKNRAKNCYGIMFYCDPVVSLI